MSDFGLLLMAVFAAAFLAVALWAGWRLFFKGGTLRDAPSAPAPQAPRRTFGKEALRAERDPADGFVAIWLNGERVEHTGAIADSQWRAAVRLFMSALNAPTANGETPAAMAGPATSPLAAAETPAPVTERPAPAAGTAATSAAADQPPPGILPDEDMAKPFLTRMRESMVKPRSYASPTLSIPPGAGKDKDQPAWMFARINDILQQRLSEQPGMPALEIFGEGSEIRIRLGAQTYTALGDVPDERARALIQAAVAEWERTETPGL